jgi:hypothetical protein
MFAPHNGSRSERALNWIALRLASLVFQAVHRLDQRNATRRDLVYARLALAFVSAIGWVVDRIPSDVPAHAHVAAGTRRRFPSRPVSAVATRRSSLE